MIDLILLSVLPSRVKTTKCINGTVNISLVKPGNAAFDNYLVMIVPGSKFTPGSVFIHKYGKVWMLGIITPSFEYLLWINASLKIRRLLESVVAVFG